MPRLLSSLHTHTFQGLPQLLTSLPPVAEVVLRDATWSEPALIRDLLHALLARPACRLQVLCATRYHQVG